MSTTVKVFVFQRRKRDGTYPIRARFIHNRKVKVVSTSLSARSDAVTRSLTVKDSKLREQMDDLEKKLWSAIISIDPIAIESMTVDEVVETVDRIVKQKEETFSLDFFKYGEKIASEKPKDSKTNYMCAIHSMEDFLGVKSLDIRAITSSMMHNYEAHLRKKHGENARAVSLYTAAIAYIHGRARQEFNNEETGDIVIANPFAYYKPPKQKQSMHRNIDSVIIQGMINDRASLTGRERLGVDLYLISFGMMGMNTPDLFSAQKPVKGVVSYERTKTRERRADNAEMKVRIESYIKPILEEYKSDDKYWLNLHKRYSTYKNLGRAANIGLEEYRKRIKLPQPLHFYSARHSWATLAYSFGINKQTINDCLCHVDPGMRVTDIYVQKDWKVMWSANATVLSNFVWASTK